LRRLELPGAAEAVTDVEVAGPPELRDRCNECVVVHAKKTSGGDKPRRSSMWVNLRGRRPPRSSRPPRSPRSPRSRPPRSPRSRPRPLPRPRPSRRSGICRAGSSCGSNFTSCEFVVEADELEELRRHARNAADLDRLAGRQLKSGDVRSLLVLQVVRDLVLRPDLQPMDVLAMGRELQHAHHVDAHALHRLDEAGPLAVAALVEDRALQRRPNPLPGHLDDAELRHPQDLRPGSIPADGVVQGPLDVPPMAFLTHVDEVVDDHARRGRGAGVGERSPWRPGDSCGTPSPRRCCCRPGSCRS